LNFSDLGLCPELSQAVADLGYTAPTPIQEKSIPYVLMGRDILGSAQTGTGKTADQQNETVHCKSLRASPPCKTRNTLPKDASVEFFRSRPMPRT